MHWGLPFQSGIFLIPEGSFELFLTTDLEVKKLSGPNLYSY